MNRQQRRNKIKQINTPAKIEQFSAELERRLRREYQEDLDKRLSAYLESYTIMMAYVLNYKCGFGAKRLPKIMNEVIRHVNMIDEGYLSLEDCKSELERVGVFLNFKGDDKSAKV